MGQYTVRKSITLKAAPEVVWDALTNPEKTKKYFFNCEVYSRWQPGSPITFKGKMFWIIPIKMEGKIVNAIPGKLLQYTLQNNGSGTKSTVTDELEYANGETTLNIADDVGDGPGAEKRFTRSEAGWDKVLGGLKKLVESGD